MKEVLFRLFWDVNGREISDNGKEGEKTRNA